MEEADQSESQELSAAGDCTAGYSALSGLQPVPVSALVRRCKLSESIFILVLYSLKGSVYR